MDKKLEKCKNAVIAAFILKSIFYFIGKSDGASGIKGAFLGNEVWIEIGNQLIPLVCILVIFDIAGGILCSLKDKPVHNAGGFWNGGQSNGFLLSSLIAFMMGIVLIGVGVVLVYYKTGSFVIILMFALGIALEIAALCFGFLYHKVMKQMADIHKLTNKKEQIELVIQAAEGLEHKEEMMTEILENLLVDCMADK